MNNRLLSHIVFAPADEAGGGGGGASGTAAETSGVKNAVLNVWGEPQPKPAPVVTEKHLKKAGKTGKPAVNDDDDDEEEGASPEGGAFDPDSEAFETGKHTPKGKKKTVPKDDDALGDEDEEEEEGGENEEEIDLELEGEDDDAPLTEKKVSGKGAKNWREQLELQSKANKKLLAELETYKKKVAKYETVATEDILDDDGGAPEQVDLKSDEKFQGFRTTVTKRLNNAVAGTGNAAASDWADSEMSTTLESLHVAMSNAPTASGKAQIVERYKKRLAREFADDKTDDDGTKAAERIVNAMVDSFPDLEGMYARRDEVTKAPASKRDQSTLYGVRRAQAEELVAAAAMDYPEALTSKNPHGVEAYLQGLSRHPRYKDRVVKARESVAGLLAGPPELSKEEASKIKAAKGDKGVEAARAQLRKDWNASRSTLATKLVEALVFFPQVGPLLKELNALRGKTEDEDDERETLAESRGATSRVPAKSRSNASPQKRLIQDLYGPASRF